MEFSGIVRRGLIALVLASFALTGAFAQDRDMDAGRSFGRHQNWLLLQLNLTAAQQQQVQALQTTLNTTIAPLGPQIQTKHGELRTLFQAVPPDRTAILAKQAEIAALQQQIQQARTDYQIGFLNLLTPAQRAIYNQYAGGNPGGGGGGWGHGHHHHHGHGFHG